jgi:hypothetical protein
MPAFQVGILAAIVSTSFCSSDLLREVIDRGAPRYLHGNADSWHGKRMKVKYLLLNSQEI